MPVIMVTDTGNEEIAVEGMKSGLSDYVLKRRLYRLSAAVSESLEKNKLRKENNKANKQSVISEEHLRGVSNYSYSLLVEPDGTLVCECVTETFTSITGFTLNEINARGGWLGLIHPDDIPKFLQRRDRLLSMRSDVSEFRILAKKGEIRWLRDYAQPVVSEKEERVIRIYGTAQNITEQKQFEETLRNAEAKYHKLIETSNDAIFITDAISGIIIDANKRSEDLVGYSRDEIIGIHQTQLHPKEEAAYYAKVFEDHVMAGKGFAKDLYVVNKVGHKIPVEINASVTFLGKKKIILGIFRDITERKQA